jgi:hypothetical protein
MDQQAIVNAFHAAAPAPTWTATPWPMPSRPKAIVQDFSPSALTVEIGDGTALQHEHARFGRCACELE